MWPAHLQAPQGHRLREGDRRGSVLPKLPKGRCWMCWQAPLNEEEYGTRLLVTLTEMYNLRISKQKSMSEPHSKANVTGDDWGSRLFFSPFPPSHSFVQECSEKQLCILVLAEGVTLSLNDFFIFDNDSSLAGNNSKHLLFTRPRN